MTDFQGLAEDAASACGYSASMHIDGGQIKTLPPLVPMLGAQGDARPDSLLKSVSDSGYFLMQESVSSGLGGRERFRILLPQDTAVQFRSALHLLARFRVQREVDVSLRHGVPNGGLHFPVVCRTFR